MHDLITKAHEYAQSWDELAVRDQCDLREQAWQRLSLIDVFDTRNFDDDGVKADLLSYVDLLEKKKELLRGDVPRRDERLIYAALHVGHAAEKVCEYLVRACDRFIIDDLDLALRDQAERLREFGTRPGEALEEPWRVDVDLLEEEIGAC